MNMVEGFKNPWKTVEPKEPQQTQGDFCDYLSLRSSWESVITYAWIHM